MNTTVASKPVVLTIAGHDPCGGAGIQADIEAIAGSGCHAVTAVTCLTVQNTCTFQRIYPVRPAQLRAQVEAIFEDIPVAACKVGLIPNIGILEQVVAILRMIPGIPVVIDPVLASGTGTNFADAKLIRYFRNYLFPMTNVLTPNTLEVGRLSGFNHDQGKAATSLLTLGCEYVLVTGTHDQSQMVINRLFHKDGLVDQAEWERLPHTYHGSGCTLSAAIAAELALGEAPITAVRNAQAYTWRALSRAFTVGRGQKLPQRLMPVNSSSPM